MNDLKSIADTALRTVLGATKALALRADDAPQPVPEPAEREHRIRELAYGYFVERGCVEGHDLDDWLRAEADVDRAGLGDGRASASAPVAH